MRKLSLLLVAFMFACVALFAQEGQNPMKMKIPTDASVRMGTLDNGMTYYIRKNSKPASSANFHIVTNIGAVQEEDHQNGLAHFLEHMAFNGIKTFPGNTMLEYLQNNGIQFGRNVNASTGQDVTQYFLQDIPLNKTPGLMDSCLLILRDWSSNILLDEKEIDEERGVISEELRQSLSGMSRVQDERIKELGNGSRYSYRNVIGTLDGLAKFPYSAINDFYKSWYRPSLQAVVIVGDFDVDMMEGKVKALFGAIPRPASEPKKEMFEVADYKETYAKTYTDKELGGTDFWVVTPVNESTIETNDQLGSFARNRVFGLISTILNKRFAKINENPNSPLISANTGNGRIFATKDLLYVMGDTKDGKELEAIELVGKEIARMRKYGVTSSELKLAVDASKKSVETAYNNRNDRQNTQLAFECVNNFADNSPIVDPETNQQLAMGMLSSLTKDAVNQYVAVMFKGLPSHISISAKELSSTEPQAVEAFNKGLAAEVEPMADKVVDTEILDGSKLVPGRTMSQAEGRVGDKMWLLSNGAVVIFKPTELKKDEMLFSASRKGGASLIEDKDFNRSVMDLMFVSSSMGGVGKHSATDLSDALSGKRASVTVNANNYYNKMSGVSSSSDIETLFKLINLKLTQQRVEADDLTSFKTMLKSRFSNYKNDPDLFFAAKQENLTVNNPARVGGIESMLSSLDEVSVESIKETFAKVFNGVSGMKFVFVGNAPVERMKQLAELYIGSIPAGTPETWINRDIKAADANEKIVFKQEGDKAQVSIDVSNKIDNSIKDVTINGILADILRIKYTQIVREKMGATYGVRSSIRTTLTPQGLDATLTASYGTNDKHIPASSDVIIEQIKELANNGPTAEDFIKAVENRKKNFVNNQINNAFWMSRINDFYVNGYDSFTDFEKMLGSLKAKDVQDAAKHILKNPRTVQLFMTSSEIK